ncbi:hypothetical protein HYU20_01670 [Candidatus Woesearchaeota archaeon]|nr:hypothetical protein [Candidatus Woesearchaeota archaeon]
MNLAKVLIASTAAIALAACAGGQQTPAAPTAQVEQAPDYFVVGNYCSQENTGGRSAFLGTLEDRISNAASAPVGADYKENVVVVIEKDTGFFAHGIQLGDGYILTVAHVTYAPISTGTHFKKLHR